MLVVVGGLIDKERKLLITQRPAGKHGALKWEFPGGKLEEDEDPRDGLIREVREELGIEIAVGDISEVIFHRYPDRSVLLLIYECHWVSGNPEPIDCEAFVWVEPGDLLRYDFLAADLDFVRRLSLHK